MRFVKSSRLIHASHHQSWEIVSIQANQPGPRTISWPSSWHYIAPRVAAALNDSRASIITFLLPGHLFGMRSAEVCFTKEVEVTRPIQDRQGWKTAQCFQEDSHLSGNKCQTPLLCLLGIWILGQYGGFLFLVWYRCGNPQVPSKVVSYQNPKQDQDLSVLNTRCPPF